jgi:hypothetical protein
LAVSRHTLLERPPRTPTSPRFRQSCGCNQGKDTGPDSETISYPVSFAGEVEADPRTEEIHKALSTNREVLGDNDLRSLARLFDQTFHACLAKGGYEYKGPIV